MRDPERLDPLLEQVRRVWRLVPHWRLTQLITNALHPREPSPEIFYTEDDDLAVRLAALEQSLRQDGTAVTELTIAAAANTLAPALRVLRDMGYEVSRVAAGDPALVATKRDVRLIGDDTLELLALAVIAERRGNAWHATDEDVDALLSLE